MPQAAYRPTTIICESCDGEYIVKPKGRVPAACSPACNQEIVKRRRRDATRVRLATWTCDLCGTPATVPHGCQRYCSKPCINRAHTLRMRFGLDALDYRRLVEHQDGLCAICSGGPLGFSELCVDHCHTTGAIRGLLCRTCNTGIGHLRDSPQLLRRALDYLEAA